MSDETDIPDAPDEPPATPPPDPDSDAATANPEAERRELKQLKEAYEQARKFDKSARKQYAIDRRYASGKADLNWAVSTNIIGAFIDVLVDNLYARDPDVNVRAAPRVDHTIAAATGPSPANPPLPQPPVAMAPGAVPSAAMPAAPPLGAPAQPGVAVPPIGLPQSQAPDPQELEERETEDFARTLELVIARLWKDGRVKKAVRKAVRSALSVGVGWLKVIFQIDKRTDPQMQTQLADAQDALERLRAKRQQIAQGDVQDVDVAERQAAELVEGLKARVEVILRKGLAIDFCPAEDVQVSLDVRDLEDYLDADWVANAIYRPKADLPMLFPRLTAEQCKRATAYYQRRPREEDHGDFEIDPRALTEKDAEQFSTQVAADDSVAFARIVELWDHRDSLIKTWVDGIDVWAREPYPPPQASSRFYPYFYLAFCETDGERHPQSLAWRLRKLQDEYSSVRSNFRLSRARSIPGVLFNAEQLDADNAKRLERGVQQEFIPIKPTNPATPLENLFAEKPHARIDPLLFDVSPILRDMEKVSGVQESQMNSVVQAKTATEAQIQMQGFSARSSADRDALEDMLTELAQYTAELALQGLEIPEVQRIAGPHAFWPHGMAIDDLLTMVEVNITAGSTGKPNTAAERQAWSVALPLIRETMVQIQQAETMGNLPLAQALTELVRETLYRMGDNIDVDRFIPKPSPAPPLPPLPRPPQVRVNLDANVPPALAAQFLPPGTPMPMGAPTGMPAAAGGAAPPPIPPIPPRAPAGGSPAAPQR